MESEQNVSDDATFNLVEASATGDIKAITEAIKKGADVNYLYVTDDQGSWGALQNAAYYGQTEAVKLLLESGADTEIMSCFYDGELAVNGTALHLASHCGHTDIITALLNKGASINATDSTYDYLTPLHASCRSGKLEAVKLLLVKGADITAFDGAEDTVVTIAAENGNLDVLKFLVVDKNAQVNVASNVQTPLLAAAENGYLDVVKFLLEKGVDINGCAVYRKDTALMMAASQGHLDLLKFLLEKGANTTAVNNEGKTALDIATPEAKEILSKGKK